MRQAQRTWRAIVSATSLDACSLVVGTLTQIVLMRSLDPAVYGQYVYACTIGIFSATITDFGLQFSGTRHVVKLGNDLPGRQLFFQAVQSLKLMLGISVAAMVLLASAITTQIPGTLAWASGLGAAGAFLLPAWYLLGRNKIQSLALTLLIARLVGLALTALLVRGPAQLWLAIALTLGTNILAAAFLIFNPEIRAVARWPQVPKLADIVAALRMGASTFPLTILPTLSALAAQNLILLSSSAHNLGLYAVADKVRSSIHGLVIAFGTAAFPSSVDRLLENRDGTKWETLKLIAANTAFAVLAALLLAWYAKDVIALIAGAEFSASAAVTRIFCWAILTSTCLYVFGVQILIPLHKHAVYVFGSAFGLAVQCLALWLLVPHSAASGAAIAFVLGDLAALLAMTPTILQCWKSLR